LVCSASTQTELTLKRQIAEQNRQIVALEGEVSSLQSQLNLERTRNGKTAIKHSSKASSATTGTQSVYTVKSGDTFSEIAKANGVSVAALISANKGVSPNKIAIKQKLVIPQANKNATTPTKSNSTTVAKTTVKKSSGTTSKSTYKVVKGDTFYGIAKKNNTTVAKLIALNPAVKPTRLKQGQELRLQTSTATPKTASTTTSTPKKKVVVKSTPVKKETPKVVAKPVIKEQPKLASQKTETVRHVEQTKNIAKTVAVTSVMTYGEFAKKNGTTTSLLNTLNGLDLPADEPMAVGSALYVPAR